MKATSLKHLMTLVLAFFALAIMTPAAIASSPHFINASACVNSAGDLVASFKEAGLGDEVVDIELSASATATYACINGGGKHPKAANKETVSSEVSATAPFTPHNGQITGTLTIAPPGPGSFSCPQGQTLVLASVSYTNVQLTDTTDNISASIPGTFSKILVNI